MVRRAKELIVLSSRSGDSLVPTFLLDQLSGDEDAHLADGARVDLLELHPPVELSHESQDQLLFGGGLPPRQTEGPAEDLGHALLQGVVEPPAVDGESHEDPREPPEVPGVVTEPREMAQVDLHQLLGAEEETGRCSNRVRGEERMEDNYTYPGCRSRG